MSGKVVRETLGFLAVVAGLVFVGVEIQQSTAAIRGQTRQALNADYLQWTLSTAGSPELFEAYSEQFLRGTAAMAGAGTARTRGPSSESGGLPGVATFTPIS